MSVIQNAHNHDTSDLRLDIAMDNMLRVEVRECVGHLVNVRRRSANGKGPSLYELPIEFTLTSKFKHEEDTLRIMKITIEAQDVWVPFRRTEEIER